MYVEVSIPIALFKTFTYIVPLDFRKQIFLGQSVFIPFNKNIINGFIVKIKSKNQYKGKLLEINHINDIPSSTTFPLNTLIILMIILLSFLMNYGKL